MLKKIVAVILLAALLCAALPAFAASTVKYATTGLNVRSGPGTKYGIVGVLQKGESVTVTGRKGSWAKLSYKGEVAYAFNKYLKTEKPAASLPSANETPDPNPNSSASLYVIKKTEKMKVNAFTGVYAEPKIKARVVAWLEEGDTVLVTGAKDHFWSIIKHDNGDYYVKTQYLTKISYAKEGCVKACTSYGCDSHCKCESCLSAKTESFYKRSGFFQVLRDNTLVYPGASASFAPLEELDDVKSYKYTGYSANWVRMDRGDGSLGYVQRERVTLITK